MIKSYRDFLSAIKDNKINNISTNDLMTKFHMGTNRTLKLVKKLESDKIIPKPSARGDNRQRKVDFKKLAQVLSKIPEESSAQERVQELSAMDKYKTYRKTIHELERESQRLTHLVDLFTKVNTVKSDPPIWMKAPTSKKKDPVIFSTILSDTHFDEVVVPSHVNYANEYNRDIATKRLKKYFDSILKLINNYMGDVSVEGIVMALGGDILSGIIHEELKETNAQHVFDGAMEWSEKIEAGIRMIRKETGIPLYIPTVVGNHGRLTRKPIYKYRIEDNLDYLIYKIIEKGLSSDPEITMEVSLATEVQWKSYDTTYLLAHGDAFFGGSGISGIATPIALGNYRKLRRQTSLGKPYDILVIGHFHQLLFLGNVIMNGSLIGLNEYAFERGLPFEKPQQAFWLTSPEHGVTIQGPVFVE